MRVLSMLVLCGGVFLPAVCAGRDEPGTGTGTRTGGDILLVTIDTLRADHVGLYGYERETTPNIDLWFGDAGVWLRSYSTTASTSQSVASLLSGLLPHEHRVRLLFQLLPDDVALIPDLLPDGYQTAAFVSNIVLTDEAMGMAGRFDHYDDFVDERESERQIYERSAGRTTEAALEWLAKERDPDRPLFLWVHYIDPHGPYRPPPDWRRRFTHSEPVAMEPARIHDWQREPGVTDGLWYVDAYDEEIAHTDAEIGRLLDGYAARWPVDEALMVLTADHGESMMERERWFTHSFHVYEELIRVPLLMRGPGVAAGRHTELVSGTDVAPTVLGFAGAAVPEEISAVDLREARGIEDDRMIFAESRTDLHHHAVVTRDRKWILSTDPGSLRIVGRSFIDLGTDPGEKASRDWPPASAPGTALRELCTRDPDPASVPRAARRGKVLRSPKIDPRASADDLERLKALGYVQ